MFGNQPRDNNIESLPPREDPQPVTGDFAVKQEPPKGTTFRKPAVVTLILLLSVIAVFSLLYGLQPLKKKMPDEEAKERLNAYASSTHTPPGPELYETLPDSYANLPDYASRKPSPVSAGQVGPADPMVGSVAGTTPAAARSYNQASCTSGAGRNEEEDVAQSSLGFKISVTHPREDGAPKLPDTSTLPPRGHQTQGQLPDDQNRQSEKRQFITQEHNGMTMLRNRLEQPHSPYMVMAGSIIPVTLITGINSDLPGNITAQVRENVFDTVTGKHLLIPQGAKINGVYDSRISYAQERVLVVWTRIIFPDGSSLNLEGMPGVDLSGYAGLRDKVDNHWGKLVTGVILSSFLSAAVKVSQGNDIAGERTFRDLAASGAAESVAQVGAKFTDRNLNVQPTLTIRPGEKFNIFVNKDMILSPYRS